MQRRRVELCGASVHAVDIDEAAEILLSWAGEDYAPLRYVVTPNVQHTVLLYEREELRAAYAEADLVLADGAPLVLLARMLREPLPGRAAGSDLVPLVLSRAPRALRVFLLGAKPGVGEQAARRIADRWPHVDVVGVHSPPMGFATDHDAQVRALEAVNTTRPDLVVVGLGSPQQECWVHRFRDRLDARVAVCAGATIDFLAGERSRAPQWMQRSGLEWAYRAWTEPRRLGARYARDGVVFPRLAYHQLRGRPLVTATARPAGVDVRTEIDVIDLRDEIDLREDITSGEGQERRDEGETLSGSPDARPTSGPAGRNPRG